jgi:transcriptional regulator with XRE-family HTH domain
MASIEDKKFLREVGRRVREQRQALGLTQEQVGHASRLHRTFIGSVERGERNVSVLNLRLLARVLRVRIAELLE